MVSNVSSTTMKGVAEKVVLNATNVSSAVSFQNSSSFFGALLVVAGRGVNVRSNVSTGDVAIYSDANKDGDGNITVQQGAGLSCTGREVILECGDLQLDGHLLAPSARLELRPAHDKGAEP